MTNAKMNITIDKEFTTIAQADKVKDDIKEFKAMYSPELIVKQFAAALEAEGEVSTVSLVCLQRGEVLTMSGKAFPGGWAFNDETHFCIEAVVWCGAEMLSLRFYTDMNLVIRLYSENRFDPHMRMFRLERFTRSEEWR